MSHFDVGYQWGYYIGIVILIGVGYLILRLQRPSKQQRWGMRVAALQSGIKGYESRLAKAEARQANPLTIARMRRKLDYKKKQLEDEAKLFAEGKLEL